MTLDLTQPIVWTAHGNMQMSDLKFFSRFEFPDSGAIVHISGYELKTTGEVVQQSVAVCAQGIDAFLESGSFGKGETK